MAKPQRAFALTAALLLLASSVAFSGLVIWQMANNDQPEDTAQVAEQLRQAAEEQTQTEGENMLQGTKLENFTPVAAVNELQIIDIKEGSGEAAVKGASITAHYTGALVKDGTIFESSKDGGQPFTANLVTLEESSDGRGLIKGWVEGIPGMKVGGIRRLIIPASLAYGETGSGSSIGPNEPLVFDIELVSVGQ